MKNIKLALVYAFSIGAAIVPTGQVIVTAFNENTKEEIMIAEGSLSPSDKVVTRGLRDQKTVTKASKSDESFNPYEEDDSVNRETEEIFNPYLEDGAGSSSVDQLLLALAKSGKTITINASNLNIDEDFKSKEKLSYYLYKKGFSIFTNSGNENPGIILFIRPDYSESQKSTFTSISGITPPNAGKLVINF